MLSVMSEELSPPDDAMFQAMREVPGAVLRTYLAPEAKVMFESLNKNACTSLKWMMADLAGEDLSTFKAGWSGYIADSEAVHNRDLWQVSPRLSQLTPEERAEIRPDNDWFIFAVVRDPRLRLFSAWQNKVLMENPHITQFRNRDWYPRHPLTRESVIEDFAKFVAFFENEPQHILRRDPHFRGQVDMLVEHAIPYTRVYEISEFKQLTSDLSEHLTKVGYQGEVHVPRANPTPLRPIGALFENGIRERIEELYADDFDRFGHLWDFSRTEAAEPWSDKDLAACETESQLGRRIDELHRLARTERAENDQSRKRIAALEDDVARLSVNPIRKAGSRARRSAGRVRRRLAKARRG